MRFFVVAILLTVLSLPLAAQTREGDVLMLQGLSARQRGSLEAALQSLTLAAGDPSFALNDYAQFEIGQTNFSSGRFAEAATAYHRLLTNFPDSLLLPKAELMLGKCYLRGKHYPQSIKTFKALIADYPEASEAAEARFMIGRAYQAAGDWKNAYSAFEETDLYHPLTYFGKSARKEIASLKRAHRRKLPVFLI